MIIHSDFINIWFEFYPKFSIFVLIIRIFNSNPRITPNRKYTKAQLEQVVYTQLDNLNAIHDLLRIMKLQNQLIESTNKKLKDEVLDFKKRVNCRTGKFEWLLVLNIM